MDTYVNVYNSHYPTSNINMSTEQHKRSTCNNIASLLICFCGSLSWFRCQLGWWLISILVVLLSYYFPCPEIMQSTSAVGVTLLTLSTLTGASMPRPIGNAMRRPIIGLLLIHFCVAPLLGIIAFFALRHVCGTPLAFGIVLSVCMPPSGLFSECAAREATGRAFLCRYALLFTAPISAFCTPALLWVVPLCCGVNDLVSPSLAYFLVLPVALLGCFVLGAIAQVIHARGSSKQHSEDVALSQYHSLFGEGKLSEMVEINHQKWLSRCTSLKVLLLILVHYMVISHIMHGNNLLGDASKAPGGRTKVDYSLTYTNAGTLVLCVFLLQVVLLAVTWRISFHSCETPEDRIAFLFSGGMKSEMLLLPLSFCALLTAPVVSNGNMPQMRFHTLFAVTTFFVVQTFSAFLTIPLRRWRIHSHCRPGTTFLPSRLDRTSNRGMSSRE